MALEIEEVFSRHVGARIRLETSDRRTFWLLADSSGLHFYSELNSAKNPIGNPIDKTADEIFDWIKQDGKNKRFMDRKGARSRSVDPVSALRNPIVLTIDTKN